MICLIKVVLPAPKNPVITVAGMRLDISLTMDCLSVQILNAWRDPIRIATGVKNVP